jgi:hypothetical protein
MSTPDSLHLAFERKGIDLPFDKVLPLKVVECDPKKSAMFRRLCKSIAELGVIEPMTVYPHRSQKGMYLLLNGHLRVQALKQLGQTEAFFLIGTEDEAYTYNHKISRVMPIQEHFMIMRALEQGVSEERIAATLDVDVGRIRQKRDLLSGICPEAVEMVKNKFVSPGALREMKRVRPMRQIEMAELMIAANTYTTTYAKCLFAATPQEQLVEPEKPKEVRGLKPEDMMRMEKELDTLGSDFKLIEQNHGRNVLNLVLAVAYLRKLLDNAAVVRFLSQRHNDILGEFHRLVASASLETSK